MVVRISPIVPLPPEFRTTTTFFNHSIMDSIKPTPPTFLDLWSMLYSNGGTNYSKYDCCCLWDSLSPEKQSELYNNIRLRLEQKRYVSYNAYQAMQESLREIERLQHHAAPPKNYNHSREFDAMVAKGCLVTANYNGEVGIYTEADATQHNMTIIKHLHP